MQVKYKISDVIKSSLSVAQMSRLFGISLYRMNQLVELDSFPEPLKLPGARRWSMKCASDFMRTYKAEK